MIKLPIAYVDEESTAIRLFQRKFSDVFDVVGLLPKGNMDELIEDIFNAEAKAVVADFKLAEYKTDVKEPIPYDGVQLVQAIRGIRHGFPCFVLTSYDSDAIQESSDVNLIYPKETLDKHLGNTTLKEKVNVQIKHYLAELKKNTEEFKALLDKRKAGGLSEQDEERLLELDAKLENSLNGDEAMPKISKHGAGVKKLSELVKSTDELIKELRKGSRT